VYVKVNHINSFLGTFVLAENGHATGPHRRNRWRIRMPFPDVRGSQTTKCPSQVRLDMSWGCTVMSDCLSRVYVEVKQNITFSRTFVLACHGGLHRRNQCCPSGCALKSTTKCRFVLAENGMSRRLGPFLSPSFYCSYSARGERIPLLRRATKTTGDMKHIRSMFQRIPASLVQSIEESLTPYNAG